MKTIAIAKYVFAAVGIGMLVGTFFLYRNTSAFVEQAARADGTVIDLVRKSKTYAPVVQFNDQKGERIEFISSSGSNPPSYTKGEKIEVLYLPSDPQKAAINDFLSLWGDCVILGAMGGIFSLIGIGIIVVLGLADRKDEYLKKHGIPIDTEFQSVEINKSLSVNGRHPFRVLSQWQNPSTAKLHVFKSHNLWFDPSTYIKGRKIRVYIEGDNPKKYYVDLSFLPELAE
jgi:hypothetical protein